MLEVLLDESLSERLVKMHRDVRFWLGACLIVAALSAIPFFGLGTFADIIQVAWLIEGIVGLTGVGSLILAYWKRDPGPPVSPEIRAMLKDVGSGGSLVVDDSILIYDGTVDRYLRLAWDRSPPATMIEGIGPDEVLSAEDVQRAIDDAKLDDEMKAYLRGRMIGAEGRFYAKVSVRRIRSRYTGPSHGPLTLVVAPQAQLIERSFNRRLLTDLNLFRHPAYKLPGNEDARLRALYEDRFRETFLHRPTHEDTIIGAPNTLFAEVSVVTSDDRVLVAEKRSEKGSTFAKIGRPWSCGVEAGIEWTKMTAEAIADGQEGYIDLLQVIKDRTKEEIGVDPAEVVSVDWLGIALECHFNIAILGVMRLRISSDELRRRSFGSFEDFKPSPKFVSFDELPARTFSRVHDHEWHTSARLRLLLTMSNHWNRQQTISDISKVRRNKLPWFWTHHGGTQANFKVS